ncbi:DUF4266 domain-containing protein [Flagellimonas myxillae]|uniref:DUF4266 domain-containing protein n=1 Tax=Flagellimonas myxillae TaxID=2942214 RepID=UPI00201EDA38|nr:DUF4266 domain-containing protein [Muricauda myxillae]MCL6265726.1 DUF4266 domain-containing protein [Muricauda myxillae]
MKPFLLRFLLLLAVTSLGSCSTTLKPYERQYINDPEMSMSGTSANKFQHYVCAIREGAIIPGGKKGSGGCGCN